MEPNIDIYFYLCETQTKIGTDCKLWLQIYITKDLVEDI